MKRKYPYPEGESTVKLVSTDWLEEHYQDKNLMIVDTQPDIHDYITEHIQGAVYFNQKLLRIPKDGRPGVYNDKDVIQNLFRKVGLEKDVPAVVYTGTGDFRGWGDGLEQTMVAYTLARFGHDNVYVLDGGLDKWKKENKPLTKEFPTLEGSDFTVAVRKDYYVDMNEVKEMKDDDDVMLLDARPASMYEGQAIWIKPGHIPGAINLPWKDLMREDNPRLLKPEDELEKILKDNGISKDKTLICSCGTGREATNEFILFKWYLKYPNVKIYEGSFTEWTAYPDNAVVTGPNPY
ncbi:MAG: sulfurtransferase [Thermoplasmatota archaeon]